MRLKYNTYTSQEGNEVVKKVRCSSLTKKALQPELAWETRITVTLDVLPGEWSCSEMPQSKTWTNLHNISRDKMSPPTKKPRAAFSVHHAERLRNVLYGISRRRTSRGDDLRWNEGTWSNKEYEQPMWNFDNEKFRKNITARNTSDSSLLALFAKLGTFKPKRSNLTKKWTNSKLTLK